MNTSDDLPGRQVDVIEKLRNRLAELQHGAENRLWPAITLTYAQSIDGCIAPFDGGSLQLSNASSQQMTHQIRAMHDAILVGINTVICDDPQLTVRLSSGNDPQPVVLDSQLRFPLDAKLLRDPCVRPIIVTSKLACDKKANQLITAGARVIRVRLQENGLIDLSQLLQRIKEMGLHSVMVEGGAKVITSFLTSRIADQLLLVIAPRFVGGLRAVHPTPTWEQEPQLQDVCYQLLEGDIVVWGSLNRGNGVKCASSSQAGVSNRLPECLPANAKKGE